MALADTLCLPALWVTIPPRVAWIFFSGQVCSIVAQFLIGLSLWPRSSALPPAEPAPYLWWYGSQPKVSDVINHVVDFYRAYPEKRQRENSDGLPRYQDTGHCDVFFLFCTEAGRAKLQDGEDVDVFQQGVFVNTAEHYMRGRNGFDPAKDLSDEVRHLQNPDFWRRLQQFVDDDDYWLTDKGRSFGLTLAGQAQVERLIQIFR